MKSKKQVERRIINKVNRFRKLSNELEELKKVKIPNKKQVKRLSRVKQLMEIVSAELDLLEWFTKSNKKPSIKRFEKKYGDKIKKEKEPKVKEK